MDDLFVISKSFEEHLNHLDIFFRKLGDANPVSYTHLDVYKRQGRSRQMPNPCSAEEEEDNKFCQHYQHKCFKTVSS